MSSPRRCVVLAASLGVIASCGGDDDDDQAIGRVACDGSVASEDGATGEADGAGGVPRRGRADFVSIKYGYGSEPLGDWVTYTVRPPYFLELVDREGEQRSRLDAAEYALVLDLVLSPEFVEAIRQPRNPDCLPVPDATGDISVTWKDIGTQTVSPGSCVFAHGSEHIYARLGVFMASLKAKYMSCEEVEPDASAPEAIRPLCRY